MASLLALDEVLAQLRALQGKPPLRSRVTSGIPGLGGVAGLRVLRAVERVSAGGLSPSVTDIADELGVDQSSASRAIHQLVRSGLVAKAASTDDQRKVLLHITRAGMRASDEALDRRIRVLEEVTSGWPDEDIERITALLGQLSEGYERVVKDSDMQEA